MEIWLRQNKKSFRFAILPSEYELTSESDNTQVNINKLGEINLIGKRKLKTVSFSSIFPKQKYSFCQYSTFPTPKESVKTIEKMKNNGRFKSYNDRNAYKHGLHNRKFHMGRKRRHKRYKFHVGI